MIAMLILAGFVPLYAARPARSKGKLKHPTALELLDKYAATADKFQSFILKSETSRKINYTGIQTIVEPKAITEVRYDGDRCFVKMLQWGKRRIKSKEFIPKEEADCVRHLWDGKLWLNYTDSERGAEYDRIKINRTSEGYKGMSTGLDYGSFLRGFFHGGKKGRIDSILRQENSASVRADMEKIGESDCYVIEADTKHGKYTFWIDPSHGYHIAKAEIQRNEIQWYNHRMSRAAPKDVRQFYSLKDVRFKKVQDVWTPVEGHVEQSTYSPRGDALIELHHVVTDITLNPDHDTLGSFEPDFIRNGALVGVVGVKGIKYRWQDGQVVDEDGREVDVDKLIKAESDKVKNPKPIRK